MGITMSIKNPLLQTVSKKIGKRTIHSANQLGTFTAIFSTRIVNRITRKLINPIEELDTAFPVF